VARVFPMWDGGRTCFRQCPRTFAKTAGPTLFFSFDSFLPICGAFLRPDLMKPLLCPVLASAYKDVQILKCARLEFRSSSLFLPQVKRPQSFQLNPLWGWPRSDFARFLAFLHFCFMSHCNRPPILQTTCSLPLVLFLIVVDH